MSFDIKRVIGSVAPWMATALGGPLAGQAVSAIAQAMGLKAEAKLDDVQQALAAGQLTGEQLVALKNADKEFEKAMTLAGYADKEALAEIAAKDRDSARNREVTLKSVTTPVLAWTIVAAFVLMVAAVLFKKTAVDTVLAGTVIGYLSAKCEQVVSYYFGSSAGSDRKTEILANGNGQPH